MKLSDEFKNCIFKYFYEDNQDIKIMIPQKYENETKELFEIISNFEILNFYNRPDGYINSNDFYILEHFEINATKTNSKGSQTRKEEARIKSKFNDTISKHKNETVRLFEELQIEISAENLYKCFRQNYLNHFNKVNSYTDNLSKSKLLDNNKNVKVCFFVEDTTPLGTFYLNKNKRTTLRIINIKECLETITSHPVDYIFLLNQYDNDKSIYFVEKEWINELLQNSMQVKDIKMIDWKPMEMRFNIPIPNKKQS